MTLTWTLNLYWNGYTGGGETNESGRLKGIATMRGKKATFGSNGFVRAAPGSLVVDLDNYDGRYDPWNTASALYPNFKPGIYVQLSVDYGSSHGVFAGIIKNIIPGIDKTRVVIADTWEWLKSTDAKVDICENINTYSAISNVLTSVDCPEYLSIGFLYGNETAIPYFWTAGRKAYDVVNELSESELGQLYVNFFGDFKYRSRQASYSIASSITITQAELLKGIYLPQPWDNIRNLVKARAHPRTLQTLQVLWTLQDIPAVSPGASVTIYTPYTYAGKSVPGYAVVSPVANTDYTMNTASTGASIDLTASFTVVQTKYGDTSKLVITNNHASLLGYIILMQIRGQPLDTPDPIEVISDKSGSNQPRILSLDFPWLQNVNIAQDFADYLCIKLKDPEPIPIIQIEDRSALQFEYDLYTKITLQIAKLGISADYYIIGIEHKSSGEGCQKITTTYYLEPTEAVSAWTFSTNIGTTSILAY